MAKQVLVAEYVSLNGTDISAYVHKGELSVEVDEQDSTTFGSNGWKETLGGLKSGELSIDLKDDVAASQIDSILWPLLGTVVAFEIRLSSAAVGASNPKYSGSVLVKDFKIGGGVGDIAEKSLSFTATGAITRATS